jgi:hypothetical protein
MWYDILVVHCAAHGVYMPPYVTHQRSTKNLIGFSCGNGVDDDLPPLFESRHSIWSQIIARGLQ